MVDIDPVKVLIFDIDESSKPTWLDFFNELPQIEVIFTTSYEEVIFYTAKMVPNKILIAKGVKQSDVISLVSQIRNTVETPIYLITDKLTIESAFKSGKAGVTELLGESENLLERLTELLLTENESIRKQFDVNIETILSDMLDASYLSIFMFDSDMNFVYFNKNGAHWMDLGPDAIGKNMLEIYPGILSTGRYDQYKNVLETGEPLEDYMVEYSGNVRRHIVRRAFRFGTYLCIISGDVGRPEDYIGVGREEAKFRDLVEMLPEIVFELDKDGKLIFLNSTTSNILGYTMEDIEADRHLSALFAPSDVKVGVKKIKGLLAGTERPESFQFDLMSSNNTRVPVEFHVKTHESTSSISGLRGIIVDLREKIETERELRESETRLRKALNQLNTILSGSPDVIIFLDNELRIKYYNKNIPIFGDMEVIDLPFFELFPEDQSLEIKELLKNVVKSRKPANYDFVYEHEYDVIYYETIAQPQLEDGVTTGVILSTRDMTERIENERQRAQLERSLISERLRYEKLEEVNQLKTNFMATATHEIRTPLTAIAGYSEIIEEMLLDEDYEQIQDMFDVVRRNVGRMLHLINELLDVQRIDRDKLELNITDTTLIKMLKTLDAEMTPRLYENFQRLVINNNVGEVNLNIDETRIHQVFTNLIINASKFSKLRQIITLDIVSDGETLQFSVTDEGVGLTKEDAEKLFEPFPDIEPTVPGKGTGLGLFISRNIVEAHGGTISVHSEGIDKGSKFAFTLPLSR